VRRAAKLASGVAAAGAGALAALWWNLVPLTIWAMTPRVPFHAEVPPVAPDYARDDAWSALPGRVDAADVAPAAWPAGDQLAAPADVFYLHPTSYLGAHWNGPFDDPALQRASDDGGARIQASAFNACCAVYAPYYRQSNGAAFYAPSPDGDRALDLTFSDVRAAFYAFLDRRGRDRPFLVVAHSQGAVLAERLIAEEIAGTPLRDHLVAAWLAGGTARASGIGDVPPCRAADDLGCVIAWNARRPGWVETAFVVAPRQPGPRLCSNLLSWGGPAPASANVGAVFLDAADTAPKPGFASARCEGDWLMVDEVGVAPRDLPSRILDRAVGVGNLHPIEFQLFWGNLRENTGARVRAARSK
jgi:hypothetical protein